MGLAMAVASVHAAGPAEHVVFPWGDSTGSIGLIEVPDGRYGPQALVTGEGGSGGALALGMGNRVNILEYAIYSVISPEGCAAILWKDQARAEDAARALRVTAKDLKELGVIDEILPEPSGGAHMDPQAMAKTVEVAVRRNLKQLRRYKPDTLVALRYKKYRAMGMVTVR